MIKGLPSAKIVCHSCYLNDKHWLEYHIHHISGTEPEWVKNDSKTFSSRWDAYRFARNNGYCRVYGLKEK